MGHSMTFEVIHNLMIKLRLYNIIINIHIEFERIKLKKIVNL
jgi:hypothetical protein